MTPSQKTALVKLMYAENKLRRELKEHYRINKGKPEPKSLSDARTEHIQAKAQYEKEVSCPLMSEQ